MSQTGSVLRGKGDRTMADREKVMREITLCTGGGPCEGCSHYDNHEDDLVGCMDELLSDALELLKEQDAENGDWITIWQEDDTTISARCSICNRISERPLGGYCKWCGAKMNQEWGVDG